MRFVRNVSPVEPFASQNICTLNPLVCRLLFMSSEAMLSLSLLFFFLLALCPLCRSIFVSVIIFFFCSFFSSSFCHLFAVALARAILARLIYDEHKLKHHFKSTQIKRFDCCTQHINIKFIKIHFLNVVVFSFRAFGVFFFFLLFCAQWWNLVFGC